MDTSLISIQYNQLMDKNCSTNVTMERIINHVDTFILNTELNPRQQQKANVSVQNYFSFAF